MSYYRIENLNTGVSDIFDTLQECVEDYNVTKDNYLNFAIYELVRGDIVTELNQDILLDIV